MNKTKSVKILALLTAAVLLLAVLFCALPFTAHEIAYGADGYYGGIQAKSLWYYSGSDFIDLEALKSEVKKWTLDSKVESDPVVIAVIDTGLDTSHELFYYEGRSRDLFFKQNGEIVCYNSFYGSTDKPTQAQLKDIKDDDVELHGTAVAGIMAMMIRELDLGQFIKLMPIKASSKASDGKSLFSRKSVANAVEWASDNGASVINMSISSPNSANAEAEWKNDANLRSAMAEAANGAVLVAAAGNNGVSSDKMKFYPASYNEVISVMYYKQDGSFNENSNYGAYDIVAPGTGIYTAGKKVNDKYQYIGGSSMASAFVSMCTALMTLKYRSQEKAGEIQSVPTSKSITATLRTKGEKFVQYQTNKFRALDIPSLLAIPTSEIGSTYLNPTGFKINEAGGKLSERTENGSLIQFYDARLDKATPLTLEAEFLPYGTNPALLNDVEWFLKYTEIKEYINEEGKNDTVEIDKEELIGRGGSLYLPPRGGEYYIEARYISEDYEFSAEIEFDVAFLPFIPGDVRVTLASQTELNVDEAVSSFLCYTRETHTFGLTGLKYIDPSKEIIWYVNGVESGRGATFDFRATKKGYYSVTATYDGKPIAFDHALAVTVKPASQRPADLATAIIVPIILAAAIGAAAAIEVKRKKQRIDK